MVFPQGIFNPNPKGKVGKNAGLVTLYSLVGEQIRNILKVIELVFYG